MVNTNRTKGNNAERYYAKIFRDLGFDKCKTSRQASRLYDDCAIDLMFLPILVQIKAGRQKGMNPSKIFSDMKDRIKENFPETSPEQHLPKILIHYKNTGNGNKRSEYDELVIMTFNTFLIFFKPYINDIQRNTSIG